MMGYNFLHFHDKARNIKLFLTLNNTVLQILSSQTHDEFDRNAFIICIHQHLIIQL